MPKGQTQSDRPNTTFSHFLTIYIKTGKVNECQGNGITLDSIKTQIKRGWALLAPLPDLYRIKTY
jgi:hypothetical protein